MNRFFIAGFVVILSIVLFSARSKHLKPEEGQMEFVSTSPTPSQPTERAPANAEAEKKKMREDISATHNCYQSQSCDFPQTDPRSYEFAVGRALTEKIKLFHNQFKNDPSTQRELVALAKQAIKIEDGFVQSAALDIFKDLPISEENLAAIEAGLQNNTDPVIAEKALNEMQRYIGTPQEAHMQSVVQSMAGGAHFASQKVGENILPFINDKSFPAYQQLQKQLPAQSRVARDLATALREYRRQRSGG